MEAAKNFNALLLYIFEIFFLASLINFRCTLDKVVKKYKKGMHEADLKNKDMSKIKAETKKQCHSMSRINIK